MHSLTFVVLGVTRCDAKKLTRDHPHLLLDDLNLNEDAVKFKYKDSRQAGRIVMFCAGRGARAAAAGLTSVLLVSPAAAVSVSCTGNDHYNSKATRLL